MATEVKSRNLTTDRGTISRGHREALLGQRGCVVWLTGLSGSGKSTVARALEEALTTAGRLVYVLDGDNLRQGLNADLGFAPEDRHENVRRSGHVAALLADAGVITITAFISPYRKGRREARQAAPRGRFIEVYVEAPIELCRRRDPKGLYRKAKQGKIPDMTGVAAAAPYEVPAKPEVVLHTARYTAAQCAQRLLAYLRRRKMIPAGPAPAKKQRSSRAV
ncbi:MAG: adenylyl-sulfate kinase [Planctomycetaceae bacterium]|nr:adenylyl-sulfate kinase [Planctomycetaceae bacterium]